MALLYFMKKVPPYVIMMSNKHRPCGIFHTGYKLPDAGVHVREQSRVNGTWRHDDTGIKKAVLGSWTTVDGPE